jgi:hypothetical protein
MSDHDPLTLVAIERGRYLVSRTRDGETVTYTVDPNLMHCSCPSGSHNRICRHLKAVLARLEGREQA